MSRPESSFLLGISSLHPAIRWLLASGLLLGIFVRTAGEEVYESSQVDVQPKLIKLADLDYPRNLREDGIEGLAITEFVVAADGRVTNPRCIATNDTQFGQAAINTIRKSRFQPGQIKGRSVSTRCQRQDEFRLLRADSKQLRISQVGSDAKKAAPPTELAFKAFQGARLNILGSAPLTYQAADINYVGNVPLVYPFEALLAATAGQVEIQFEIGKDACVHSLQVINASAPEFALAAQSRLAGAWFRPDNKGPFVAKFDFKPDGSGDATVNRFDKTLLKILRTRSEDIRSSGFDVRPKALRTVPPKPPAAQSTSGMAVIEVLVDSHGSPHLPRVVSCTAPEFGSAAAQAAAMWLFSPAQLDGKPVVSRVQIPFSFELAQPGQ